MAFISGQLITASEYNALATKVNKVFADNNPTAQYTLAFQGAVPTNQSQTGALMYIHESDYPSASPGVGPFSLENISGGFVVAQVGNEVLTSGYTIDWTNRTISFTLPLPAATRIVVYDRSHHVFGWGNSAVVNNLTDGQIIQGVHMNSVVNRTNIMLDHIGWTQQLTTVSPEDVIYGVDYAGVDGQLDNSVYSSDYHLQVDEATYYTLASFSRTDDWTQQLIGEVAYVFPNYSKARHFFNAGGQIRCSIEMTGLASNAGFTDWNDVVVSTGTVNFAAKNTTQSGSNGSSHGKGFYHLTEDWQLVFTGRQASSSAYSSYSSYGTAFTIKYYARWSTTGTDHRVEVRVVMDDSEFHLEPEVVSGTTTFLASILSPDDMIKNSVTFSVDEPTVVVIRQFVEELPEVITIDAGGSSALITEILDAGDASAEPTDSLNGGDA